MNSRMCEVIDTTPEKAWRILLETLDYLEED